MIAKISVRRPVKYFLCLGISIILIFKLIERERSLPWIQRVRDIDNEKSFYPKPLTFPKEDVPIKPREPTPVVLLTYMRSGSSFLGNVLQANPDVYYLFEPLHAIQFDVRSHETFTFLNGTSRKYDNFLDVAKLTVEGLLTCNVDIIPVNMWSNGFLVFSKKAKGMRFCVMKAKTSAERYACVNHTKNVCLNSSHTALKIIRIPMDLLEPLMTSMPKLRILHLIRDPRATILSQKMYGVIKEAHFLQSVTQFCNRVYKDVITAERFQTYFPGRTLRIFYEDIAKDPKSYTNIVYNFTDMTITDKIESEVHSMTSEEVPKDCGQLCARKSNSTAQAEAWRKDVPMDLVATVDQVCQPLYSKLGYINVDSVRMLRDITVPLRSTVTTFDDFRYA